MNVMPLVLSLPLATACATSGYANLAAQDHPVPEPALAVVPTTAQVPETVVTEIKDGNGVRIGSEETIVGYHSVVNGFALHRGDQRVDEQDFYELARDRDGLDAVERARSRGMLMNRAGLALVIAGSAAAIAVPIALGRSAAPYAVGQWFVSFPVGLGLVMFGQRRFEDPILPAERAFQALGQAPEAWTARLH